jgi:glutamate carboxypeptidase
VNDSILQALQNKQRDILADIQTIVEKESPTRNKALVDECGREIRKLVKQRLGAEAEVFKREAFGDHFKYTFGSGEQQLLILAHFDTVWPQGHLAYKEEGNRAYGPGILDMKGGLVQAIWAIKTLIEQNIPLNKKIVLLCNSDHEGVSSPDSRKLIETEAQKSVAVLVPEAAEPYTVKVARKGILRYTLSVTGRSAHSGNNHEKGINAIVELTHHIQYLAQQTDYSKGTTVNVGEIKGGTGINVVPAKAEASVDVRVSTMAEAMRMQTLVESLQPCHPEAKMTVSGGIVRPTLEQSSQSKKLFELVHSFGKQLGYEVDGVFAGGGSDGSFASALGTPVLDGLGAAGKGPHAEHEHILINHLEKRTVLLAHLIQALVK